MVGNMVMDVRRARGIVLAWVNKVPIEAMLDDHAMSVVQRPPNTDEVREAFRTLATAPGITTEEFAMFVAGNYRMFVAQTERLSAREAARRAKPDLDAWQSEAEARRSGARLLWNILKDLSPYLVIGGIILAIYASYAMLALRVVDDWLLPPTTRHPVLLDIAVFGISFVVTIAVMLLEDRRKVVQSWWSYPVLLGVPWAVALALHFGFA